MRDPLENVTIGNFLYGLGLSMGSRAGDRAPAGCVNLLQQTPLDRRLGDVMLEYPCVFRLIEFKRRAADLRKELLKLRTLKAALKRQPDLVEVSREVHWYAETFESSPEFTFTARRYLNLRKRDEVPLGFVDFVNGIVDQALNTGRQTDLALIAEYLEAVAIFAGKASGTYSGMLVSIGPNGGVRYVVVSDIRDVRLTAAQILERAAEQERAAELAQDTELQRRMVQTRARERGGRSR
jgi:hypothetical protein